MRVRGPTNNGGAVQTDPTLLRYASAITEQLVKKCWELPAQKFDQFKTLRNNSQQHATTCNRECKRIKHCCATLRRSRNKRIVGSCWLKSLTGFKLCATTSNNMQQGVETDATCNIQQCWELLANDDASVCTGLKTHLTGHKHAPTCFFHSCGNVLYEKKRSSQYFVKS